MAGFGTAIKEVSDALEHAAAPAAPAALAAQVVPHAAEYWSPKLLRENNDNNADDATDDFDDQVRLCERATCGTHTHSA